MKKISLSIILALLPMFATTSFASTDARGTTTMLAHHTKKDASIKKPATPVVKTVVA